MNEIVQIIIQAGALGALLVLLYFLFKIIIPKAMEVFTSALKEMNENHTELLKMQHGDFKEALADQRKVYGERLRDIEKSTSQLGIIMMYHDATVRGENPETVGSTQEILDLLRRRANGDRN